MSSIKINWRRVIFQTVVFRFVWAKQKAEKVKEKALPCKYENKNPLQHGENKYGGKSTKIQNFLQIWIANALYDFLTKSL